MGASVHHIEQCCDTVCYLFYTNIYTGPVSASTSKIVKILLILNKTMLRHYVKENLMSSKSCHAGKLTEYVPSEEVLINKSFLP